MSISKSALGWIALFAAIGVGGYYFWDAQRLKCSSPQVRDLATTTLKDSVLKLVQGNDVVLRYIGTLRTLDSGGATCTAETEIKGGSDDPIYRKVEYSFERDGQHVIVLTRIIQ